MGDFGIFAQRNATFLQAAMEASKIGIFHQEARNFPVVDGG
jgi:hypothetical protein